MRTLQVVTFAVLAFLLAPLVVVFISAFSAANYITFPPRSFSMRWFSELLERSEFVDSMLLSLTIAVIVSIISTTVGGIAAVALIRFQFPGQRFLSALFMSPLVLPGVVIGIALLQFFSQVWIFGAPLSTRSASLVIGHVIITIPYAIRLISASLVGQERSLELAARSLGATPVGAFVRITLPSISTGVFSSAVFTFLVSFDNVTISVFLATPQMVPIPVRIYTMMENVTTPLVASVSSILMLVTVIMVVMIERTLGLQRLMGGRS